MREASTREVFRKVRGVCVDGQLLKTTQEMQLSRTSCMNHARSRSYHPCRDPLHDADMFKEQYERLFASKGAVLKDLQNSHVWKEQFMACQRQLLAEGDLCRRRPQEMPTRHAACTAPL